MPWHMGALWVDGCATGTHVVNMSGNEFTSGFDALANACVGRTITLHATGNASPQMETLRDVIDQALADFPGGVVTFRGDLWYFATASVFNPDSPTVNDRIGAWWMYDYIHQRFGGVDADPQHYLFVGIWRDQDGVRTTLYGNDYPEPYVGSFPTSVDSSFGYTPLEPSGIFTGGDYTLDVPDSTAGIIQWEYSAGSTGANDFVDIADLFDTFTFTWG